MKIFDCFTFYNEEEILKIRLEELNKFVDYFIIIEASETFTGKKKDIFFSNPPKWIEKWEDKIMVNIIDFPELCQTAWDREYFQRNEITSYLQNLNVDDDDLIIISDVDEIWNVETVTNLKYKYIPVKLDVKQYFWNFNWLVPDHCNQGSRPVVCKKSHIENRTAQDLRSMDLPVVPNGGWHFSFFGEKEKIKNKIESFAHTEYDQEVYKSYELILFRIQNGIDPFDRFPLKYHEIDETYPKYVRNNFK